MRILSPKSLTFATYFAVLSFGAWAQEAADTAATETNAIAPSMDDVLKSVAQDEPTPAASNQPPQTAEPPTDAEQPAIPTGTMVKPAVTDTQPTDVVPAQPLENMNPALMPQTPSDEAPKAVRAETAPTPPKPPAYEPQPYVTLQTLDKVTARTATMTAKVGDTVAIGPLFVQVKTCQKAAPLETPDSAAFLQVWEAKPKDAPVTDDKGPSQWVFSGWMFASSPALSAMDHPIYDIWVLNCKKSATDDAEKSAGKKDSGTQPAGKTAAAKTAETADDTPLVDSEAGDEDPDPVAPSPDNASANKAE